MKKLVALYKAYRGGEWFRASLESVRPFTVGAVVMLSEKPWVSGGDPPENCYAPALEFERIYDYPIVTIRGTWDNQEDQYQDGLDAIREKLGDEVGILVVDTDEVWLPQDLALLIQHITNHPECHYFAAHIYSYIKSPLYQAYPLETAMPCVALQSPKPQKILGRFRGRTAGKTHACRDVFFHHYSFVRETEDDVRLKFKTTESQEDGPFRPDWMETVWPNLPNGKDLHVAKGWEHAWKEIKVLSSPPIVLPGFCADIIRSEGGVL